MATKRVLKVTVKMGLSPRSLDMLHASNDGEHQISLQASCMSILAIQLPLTRIEIH
jgi:hypothetical protein